MRLLAVVAAVVAGSLVGPRTIAGQSDTKPVADWVAFAAEFKSERPGGPAVVGRFFRDVNGSSRSESGASLEEIQVISIQNVPKSLFFNLTPNRGWTQQPMILPPNGYHPPQTMEHIPGIMPSDEKTEGLETIYRSVNGTKTVMAPALNFFTILSENESTGRVQRYTNIRIGPVDGRLFEPPADATITKLDTPGGIVWRAPSEKK